MLQKMKELGVLFSLCFVCVFSGCEKDTFEETFEKKGNPLTIKKLPFESLKNNPALLHKLEQLNAKKAAFFGKMVTDPVHNFSFDTEDVTYIENGSHHSYTFPIVRTVPGLYVENLVLNREEDGVYHAYITTYKLSREQVLRLGTVGSLNDKMTIRALPDFDMAVLGKGKLKPCHTLITVPVAWNEQGQVTHSELIELIDKDCIDQLNSGGQTSTGDGNSGNGGASDGGWGGWMGTGYDTGVYNPPGENNGNDTGAEGSVGHVGGGGAAYGDGSPVITTPVVPMTFTSFIKNFKQGVSQLVPDNQWWNTTNGKKIVQYLQHNFNTQTGSVDFQVSEFAAQLIVESIKTGLTFDPHKSFLSPANIDLTSVAGNTEEEKKFNFIYNQLLKSPSFKVLFVDLFSDNEKINVKFTIENIPQEANGHIRGTCRLTKYGTGELFNSITIDRSVLLNNSNVDIAQTIIHECIHAFLNIKLNSPDLGIPIANINNMDFSQCINTFYNGFSGLETQHSFFVDHMIPISVSILLEIKDLILNAQQINSVENPEPNSVIYNVTQTNPSIKIYEQIVPWNWNHYFTHVSYQGLQLCSAFPIIYPQGSPNLLNWMQYISIGILNFNTTP